MLFGERGNTKVVAAIDRLTSLYAIRQLDDTVIEGIADLAKTEAKGMDFLVLYLADVARKERAKATTDEARLNGYKGYIPSEKHDGSSLMVADDREHNKLVGLGTPALPCIQTGSSCHLQIFPAIAGLRTMVRPLSFVSRYLALTSMYSSVSQREHLKGGTWA